MLPTRMREHFGYLCKDISDHEHRELKTDDVLRVFTLSYLNINAPISVRNVRFEPLAGGAGCDVTFARTASLPSCTRPATAAWMLSATP